MPSGSVYCRLFSAEIERRNVVLKNQFEHANCDRSPWRKSCLCLDALTVDPNSIAAVKVGDVVRAGIGADFSVKAGYRLVGENHVVAYVASDPYGPIAQRQFVFDGVAAEKDESWHG